MGFAYDRQHTGATSNGVDWEGLRPAADYGSNSAQQDQVAAQAAPGPTSWLEMSCPAGARVAQEGVEEAYAPGWARDEGETGEGASFAFGAGQVLAQGAPTASPVSPDHPDATKKLFAAQRFRRRLPGRVPELSAGPGACTARRLARGAAAEPRPLLRLAHLAPRCRALARRAHSGGVSPTAPRRAGLPLEGPAAVAPLLLKTPQRLAAMGLVFALALMVRNYIEHVVRHRLVEQKQTLPYYGRKKPVDNPTAEVIFHAFAPVQLEVLTVQGRVARRTVKHLSDPARLVLDILGITPEVFSRVRNSSRTLPQPTE
jgi:hypothetical protein